MKILVFSDIHNDMKALERLMAMDADYYIAAGDMVNWERGLDRAGEILARRADRTWVLPGNHETVNGIADVCKQYGLNEFHGRSFEADGIHVAGLGYSNTTPFNTPGEYTEEELAKRLKDFDDLDPLVLICHAPPKETTLDQLGNEHAGSQAVRDFIDRRRPAAFFCGHIHEAQGRHETIGRTLAYNAGKEGVLFDFDKLKS